MILIDKRYDLTRKPIDCLNPVRDTFLDQLTWENTILLVSNGNRTGHLHVTLCDKNLLGHGGHALELRVLHLRNSGARDPRRGGPPDE